MGNRVGLLTGSLVLALGSGVVAQDPSPSPATGAKRVELPRAGLAVTYPVGWRLELPRPGGTWLHEADDLWSKQACAMQWFPGPTTSEAVAERAAIHAETNGAKVLARKLGVELGADGTVWLAGVNPLMVDAEPVRSGDSPFAAPAESFVMRYDGTGWQRWGPDDGVPSLTWSHPQLEQDPDGGLWVVAQPDPWYMPEDAADPPFDGIAHFDGSTWQYFLAGHDVDGWDIAPDSSVWLRADGAVYVITPEAVAAAE